MASAPDPQSTQIDADRVIHDLGQKLGEAHVEIAKLNAVIAQLFEEKNAAARAAEEAAAKGAKA